MKNFNVITMSVSDDCNFSEEKLRKALEAKFERPVGEIKVSDDGKSVTAELMPVSSRMLGSDVAKNFTEYGSFIDLGGIDGLLHITDMSWK
ncbi:hypothetical protein QS468_42715 [Bacillus subtilis]|jgi:hypothetical protein|nr:hypothetical protein [Bacillus subtilis]